MRIVIYGNGVVGKATCLILERAGLLPKAWDVLEDRRTCTWSDVLNADVIFLCLSAMKSVEGDSALLSREVQKLDDLGYQGAYVQRTTCVPGTADTLRNTFGLARRYAVYPEFLREAHWQEDALNPERVVIGVPKQAVDAPPTLPPVPVVQFLREIAQKVFPADTPVFSLTLTQAELVKLIANAALATRISFWNELMERFHADIDGALFDAVVSDSRLKSFDVFFGRSWGGKCLSKDVPALATLVPNVVIAGVHAVNERLRAIEAKTDVRQAGV